MTPLQNKDTLLYFVYSLLFLSENQVLNMSINLTGNTSVASDVTPGQETVSEGVISTLKTTPVESSGFSTTERPTQDAPLGHLANFLSRRTVLKKYTFTSSNGGNSQMDSFDPHSLFFASTVIADKVKNFYAWRGTFKITITSSFPSGTYGLYCFSAVPLGGSVPSTGGTIVGANLPYRQALHVPHALIHVENATDGEILIPFICPYDYSPMALVSLWEIKLWCLQPVSSAVADSTLTGNCTVYGEFLPDFEMVIPVQQGGKSAGSTAKGVAGAVSSIAGALSSVPVIGEFAAPIAAGASAIHSVLDWFGFTRTTHQKTPDVYTRRIMSNVANIDCDDTSEIAALSVSNTVSFDPRIGGGEPEDPGAFASIFKHWTQVAQFTWSAAQDSGTVIGSFNVSPFFTDQLTAHNDSFDLTSAGYVGLPFKFWRGDMEYKVLIPVSMFHRGVIQFVWTGVPGLGSHDPTNQIYNIIMDVTGQADLTMKVGYSKVNPVSLCHPHSTIYPPVTNTQWFNGQVSIIVVNPLRAPVDSSVTNIRIYARACDNMQFGLPKSYEPWEDGEELPILQDIDYAWLLQGAVGDGSREEIIMDLVPPSKPYPACEILWGEDVKSVRALMQKIEPLWETVTGLNFDQPTEDPESTTWKWIFDHFPNQANNFITFDGTNVRRYGDRYAQLNYASWYRYLFVGIAGSTRYKIMPGGVDSKIVRGSAWPVSFTEYTAASNNGLSDVMTASKCSPDTIVSFGDAYEITVPYYGHKKFFHARFNPDLNYTQAELPSVSQEYVRSDIIIQRGMDSSIPVANRKGALIYRGAGPDLRLVQYRFPPTIINTGLTTDPWGDGPL